MVKIKFQFVFFSLALITAGVFGWTENSRLAEGDFAYRPQEFLLKLKGNPEIYKIKLSDEAEITDLIAKYQGLSGVEFLEPNYVYQATAFPSDTDFNQQWYLSSINAKEAWSKELLTRETENNNRRAVLAILDTGVDLDHPDLKDKIWINVRERAGDNIDNDGNGFIDDVNGWDFLENDANPNPTLTGDYNAQAIMHGTIVAGVAAASANNAQGIAGVSWFTQIMPLKVLTGKGEGDVYSVIQAIDYAVANGADVINMSFVGTGYSQSLYNAVKRAYDAGKIVVAAAGNTDTTVNGIDLDLEKYYPVCFTGPNQENLVIGVASVGRTLSKSGFSNYGSCIDIAAPGEEFYSTQLFDIKSPEFSQPFGGFWSGTSLSAPLVSGSFGLIKGLRPGITAESLRKAILTSATNINSYNKDFENRLGSGLLDLKAAVNLALGQNNQIVSTSAAGNYLVAGLGYGSFPQLKIVKSDGSVFKEFFAYSPTFAGAINVAVCDTNGDGQKEIVTSAGPGGGPHIRIFNINGQVLSQFFAYDSKFRGGVEIACDDLTGDGKAEIITASGKGLKPEVKIFNSSGGKLGSFLAYGQTFLGGFDVSVGDVDLDGQKEIVTGAGTGGGPHVRIFDLTGNVKQQFFAFNTTFRGGISVTVGDLHGDGQAEILVSPLRDSTATIKIFNQHGGLLTSFMAYEATYLKGVSTAVGDMDGDKISEVIAGQNYGGSALVRFFSLEGKNKGEVWVHDKNYRGGARPAYLNQ